MKGISKRRWEYQLKLEPKKTPTRRPPRILREAVKFGEGEKMKWECGDVLFPTASKEMMGWSVKRTKAKKYVDQRGRGGLPREGQLRHEL